MTFGLVRLGWPNTAAILALAIMPIVALTTAPQRQLAPVAVVQIEPATICLTLVECTVVVTADATIVE